MIAHQVFQRALLFRIDLPGVIAQECQSTLQGESNNSKNNAGFVLTISWDILGSCLNR